MSLESQTAADTCGMQTIQALESARKRSVQKELQPIMKASPRWSNRTVMSYYTVRSVEQTTEQMHRPRAAGSPTLPVQTAKKPH